MRVVSWNLQKRTGKDLDVVIAALRSVRPDLLLLQAVTRASLATLGPPVRILGLEHATTTVDDAERAGKYAANAIMSRWPLRASPSGWASAPVRKDPALAGYRDLFPDWAGSAPRPWLLARAEIQAPSGAIDVIDAHMPGTTKNGHDKVKSFIALASVLERAAPAPRLVGGAFASPRSEEHGKVLCFGGRYKKRGPLWEQAEQAIITGLPARGLRDVYRARHGYESGHARDDYSHIAGTARRRFDHLFASSDFHTAAVEYRTDWLSQHISDHAPIIADLYWASGAEA